MSVVHNKYLFVKYLRRVYLIFMKKRPCVCSTLHLSDNNDNDAKQVVMFRINYL